MDPKPDQISKCDDIPILFMTARDDLASKQRGFRIAPEIIRLTDELMK